MTTTEKNLQEGLQTIVRALTNFADEDVLINDYSVLDYSGLEGPFFVVEDAHTFSQRVGIKSAQRERWQIRGALIAYLANLSWQDGMDGFRDARQAILNAFSAEGTARSLGGIAGVLVSEIRNEGPIAFVYGYGVDPDIDADALPYYAMQMLIFDVEVFT